MKNFIFFSLHAFSFICKFSCHLSSLTVYYFWRCTWNTQNVKLKSFFFPEMRLYFLMFITAIWFLLRPKWERFFKLSQEKVSGLMDHKAVWIRYVFDYRPQFFSIQVLITLILLPSAPKLTATTNNDSTHQQFIFRSLRSGSSSNPEIADNKVILGKEISKSVKSFQKTKTFLVYYPSSVWEKIRDMLSSVLYWSRLSCPVSCSQQLYLAPACLRRIFYLSWYYLCLKTVGDHKNISNSELLIEPTSTD